MFLMEPDWQGAATLLLEKIRTEDGTQAIARELRRYWLAGVENGKGGTQVAKLPYVAPTLSPVATAGAAMGLISSGGPRNTQPVPEMMRHIPVGRAEVPESRESLTANGAKADPVERPVPVTGLPMLSPGQQAQGFQGPLPDDLDVKGEGAGARIVSTVLGE